MGRLRAPEHPSPPYAEEQVQWPLWGGSARVVVRPASGQTHALDEARAVVGEITAAMDLATSRFRPDSEVCQLAAAGGRPRFASDLLRRTLNVALRAARLTDGAVDPTLGHALVAAGYDRDLSELPADRPERVVRVRRAADWHDVVVDDGAGTVSLPDGVLLDLGATAKAYAADLAAARVHERLDCPVLVSLCGDLAIAGTRPDQPWVVQVLERPDDLAGPLIAVGDCGLATSTTRARRWRMSGRPAHHLLDPVTGLPVREVWRTVTATAATCVDANTATTATVVKGDRGLGWVRASGLSARLVAADGAVTTVGGWPAEVAE